MRRFSPLAALLLGALAFPVTVLAHPITEADKAATIELLAKRLEVNYIIPEASQKMADALRSHLSKGDYAKAGTHEEFAKLLKTHLQATHKDKHLGIRYMAEGAPEDRPSGQRKTPPEELARMRSWGQTVNFGFEKMERLTGNVMYLKLRGFPDHDVAKETISTMMNATAYADALIVDLRQNGGGDPHTVAHAISYLVGDKKEQLTSMYFRAENKTQEFWTNPAVPGPRLGAGKPVYILTSEKTFSAAEDFTYTLQSMKRATVVGETTGGGAHPIAPFRINSHMVAIIPVGKSINPITKSNWEGIGITPDVAVPADKALDKAHVLALKALLPAADKYNQEGMRKKLAELEG